MADLRKLMKERSQASRIEHPYARYSNSGALSCSLCTLAIKSAVLWPSHLTSKVHRTNARKQKDEEDARQAAQTESLKRAAQPDDEEQQDDDTQQKRLRLDDGEEEQLGTSASPLPPGFFDDPLHAQTSTADIQQSQANQQGGATGDEDEEWAAFEATLAKPDIPVPGPSNPTPFAAGATISAEEVLYNKDEEDDEAAEGQGGNEGDEQEDEDAEPEETEAERREREEREELMERIETEEREQQEADERVDALKKRLSAIRAAKKADIAAPHASGPVGKSLLGKANGGDHEPTAAPRGSARQRRNRRLGREA